jgi:hypothetical protein
MTGLEIFGLVAPVVLLIVVSFGGLWLTKP